MKRSGDHQAARLFLWFQACLLAVSLSTLPATAAETKPTPGKNASEARPAAAKSAPDAKPAATKPADDGTAAAKAHDDGKTAAAKSAEASKNPSESKEPIKINADTLVADDAGKFAEFIGNVKATQGDTTITAERLKIFYTGGSGGGQKGSPLSGVGGGGSIKEVVATGNVLINFDKRVATTDRAEYQVETGILTLIGTNSKITSDNNYVIGDRITFNRNEGKAKVESASKQRVEALFYSGGKGLN
jgi:lipopolysaccharide transport protein LptA